MTITESVKTYENKTKKKWKKTCDGTQNSQRLNDWIWSVCNQLLKVSRLDSGLLQGCISSPLGLISSTTFNDFLGCNNLSSGLSQFLGKSFSIISEAILSHMSLNLSYTLETLIYQSPIFIFPLNIHSRRI